MVDNLVSFCPQNDIGSADIRQEQLTSELPITDLSRPTRLFAE
jgi:hypothetical protein